MKALILRGKHKGKEFEISQWCNDWFSVNTGDHTIDRQPFSPSALAFKAEDMETIVNHNNNGQLFTWYEVASLNKPNGDYALTFKKKKIQYRAKDSLSFSQAYICIKAHGGMVHTYRDGGRMLIGADWTVEQLVESMKKYEHTIRLTGEHARAMKHGIAFFDDLGAVFVETIEEELKELEAQL